LNEYIIMKSPMFGDELSLKHIAECCYPSMNV
jgi:hypothetical protein